MTEIRRLQPHDPLPEGHSVVLLRRFEEDRPREIMLEMIVRNPDKSEETSRLIGDDGHAMSWTQAEKVAKARAVEEGLKRIWRIDRLAGRREQEIIAHNGAHDFSGDILDDDNLEDGEHGADLRDIRNNGAPRRF
jgi:hypothetical protein